MIEILGVLATILAVLGVMLNNRQRIECFKLWIVSNSLSLAIHLVTGTWSLAVRDAIFAVMAVAGKRQWGRRGMINWELFRITKGIKHV
jgi:nicotinamide riboside transporter PnuC